MKIIGLTGFAKSGKSTAAEVLKEMGGSEVAFAKHLKDVCSLVFGIPREDFDDQKVKELPFSFARIIMKSDIESILDFFEVPKRFQPAAMLAHQGKRLLSPRHIAQYIGTEVLRGVDTNIHVNMAFKLNESNPAPFFICSDVRFQNEIDAVSGRKGLILGITRKAATPSDPSKLHPSESEIPSLINSLNEENVIENETTIEEFKSKVKKLADEYVSDFWNNI